MRSDARELLRHQGRGRDRDVRDAREAPVLTEVHGRGRSRQGPPPALVGEAVTLLDVFVGALECDVLLGDVRSLKQKRAVVRPVLAELRRFEVAAAEAGHLDLHRRALLGIGCVAADARHVTTVLERCERLVAAHPEFELLSVRHRLWGPED